MEDNQAQPPASHHSLPQPRKFIYRAVGAEPECSHPMRRSTDMPRAFQGVGGELSGRTQLLKFRVYLHLN